MLSARCVTIRLFTLPHNRHTYASLFIIPFYGLDDEFVSA